MQREHSPTAHFKYTVQNESENRVSQTSKGLRRPSMSQYQRVSKTIMKTFGSNIGPGNNNMDSEGLMFQSTTYRGSRYGDKVPSDHSINQDLNTDSSHADH